MMANFHYRLLVVDDEPPIRDLFQGSLSTEGYEVRVAKDGFEALAQMRGALPDLILSDLKMPNMSRLEFPSVVRRRFPQIPTIAISELRTLECLFCNAPVRVVVEETPHASGLPVTEKDRTA